MTHSLSTKSAGSNNFSFLSVLGKMADNQEVTLGKWEKFENELDNTEANQGQEFNKFIESRKNSTDNTSIFTSSGNQDRYKEFSRLDQESGYKGWSIDIRGKRKIYIF